MLHRLRVWKKKILWKSGAETETQILSWQGKEQELFDRWKGKTNRVYSLPPNFHYFHRKAPTRRGGREGRGGVDCKCQLAQREKKYFAFIRTVVMFMISLRRRNVLAPNTLWNCVPGSTFSEISARQWHLHWHNCINSTDIQDLWLHRKWVNQWHIGKGNKDELYSMNQLAPISVCVPGVLKRHKSTKGPRRSKLWCQQCI